MLQLQLLGRLLPDLNPSLLSTQPKVLKFSKKELTIISYESQAFLYL